MKQLISADRIQDRVRELATEIRADYVDAPFMVVGILTGSLVFLADLIRRIDLPLKIGLISASSYRGTAVSPGELHINDDLLPDPRGRHILLLDDILDTGQTISKVVEHFRKLGAESVRTCVLLRKLGRQTHSFEPNYCGFTIPNVFVVGYGLDHNDEFRHLPFLAELANEAGSSNRPTFTPSPKAP